MSEKIPNISLTSSPVVAKKRRLTKHWAVGGEEIECKVSDEVKKELIEKYGSLKKVPLSEEYE